MPELPEVETYRRALEPRLAGRRIVGAAIRDPRLTMPEDPEHVAALLRGQRIVEVGRRGKYLALRFEGGDTLLVHLRMTGGFPDDSTSHVRAELELDDGTVVHYRDVRRFGTWRLLASEELEPYLAARLGPEPLERRFTSSYLRERLARRHAAVKAVLLDQRVVAGLGNIYADETLWRARVHPLRPADEVTEGEARALARAVRAALRRGIARQGADLGDGAYTVGDMQDEFRVYGRDGEPCPRCGTLIEKRRVAGRGTHFCPTCQR